MHLVIALLLPLLLALGTPMASTPEATPKSGPLGGPLEIAPYPTGMTPDTVSARTTSGMAGMQPGETWQMVLGTVECCYVFIPGDQDAVWTVSPVDGVTVDDDGLLTIDEDVPDGTIFTVTANRDPVGPSASLRVYVYTPAAQPLVGLWHETAQLACGTGKETEPDEAIGELRFGADGQFSVTWHPFEIFVDYWGTYRADPVTGELTLTMESSMGAPPEDFDGEGTFAIRDDGSLVLEDIWLGSGPGTEESEPGCGHVFAAR
jgi:hypothetical protein